MPELPEVETIKRFLNSQIIGKKIKEITIFKSKSFIGDPKAIIGAKIIAIERRAKILIIKLSNNKNLLVHLKMSGQLVLNEKLNNKYTRIIISFNDNSQLFFNDLRMFGWIKVIDNLNLKSQISKFGPEPFDKKFTTDYMKNIFSRTRRPIKLVLMDQEKIAGIGNIYANEILFDSRINPLKRANQLPREDIKILRYSILRILREAIKYNGSSATDEAYIQPTGEKGSYQKHFSVYQREKEKCKRCGNKIERINLGGRGTFYCSACQS